MSRVFRFFRQVKSNFLRPYLTLGPLESAGNSKTSQKRVKKPFSTFPPFTRTECRYHEVPRHVMALAPLLKRRRCCILDLGYLLDDSKPNGSSLNRNMLINAGASMIARL
jgi:hypothetical protein